MHCCRFVSKVLLTGFPQIHLSKQTIALHAPQLKENFHSSLISSKAASGLQNALGPKSGPMALAFLIQTRAEQIRYSYRIVTVQALLGGWRGGQRCVNVAYIAYMANAKKGRI